MNDDDDEGCLTIRILLVVIYKNADIFYLAFTSIIASSRPFNCHSSMMIFLIPERERKMILHPTIF